MATVLLGGAGELLVPDELETLAPGTAQRAKGRERVRGILQVAFELLGKGDLSEFSMRNIAARARVDLKNVQYYFPTRKDLVRALLECLGHQHQEELSEVTAEAEDMCPADVLRTHLERWLDENFHPHIRRFNIHSWVIFDSSFEYSGEGLVQFYERFLKRISDCVGGLVPDIDAVELNVRTHMIASLLEGAMLTCCDIKGRDLKNMRDRTITEAMRIAHG